MTQPAAPEGGFADVWAFLGTVAAAATVVVGNFVRGWRRARDGGEVVAKTVVLERADLADLTDAQRLLIEIRPRLEAETPLTPAEMAVIISPRGT